jgi:CDP-L-myo-inositol myo-inositolphosphotransferase
VRGRDDIGLEIAFAPGEADRRVAGVATAARVVGCLAERLSGPIVLAVPEGKLAATTLDDLRRLNPGAVVHLIAERSAAAQPAPRLSARDILRATAKPSDGVVSRWLNRPVSRSISALLLHLPWIRPLHATIGTAVLAVLMFVALALGGREGLIVGALLFHSASVFDGVDGEIARATFRTSRMGALLDGVIDMATNILFFLGVVLNLSSQYPIAVTLGGSGLLLHILGLLAISRTAARADRPFSMDVVKQRYRTRFPGSASARLIRVLTIVTSRDFFALLFALLILAGLPMAVIYLFTAAAVIWIIFVIGALVVTAPATPAERSA